MARSTYLSFSTLFEVPSINLSNIKNTEKFLGMPRIKPRTAWREAQTCSVLYTPPHPKKFTDIKSSELHLHQIAADRFEWSSQMDVQLQEFHETSPPVDEIFPTKLKTTTNSF